MAKIDAKAKELKQALSFREREEAERSPEEKRSDAVFNALLAEYYKKAKLVVPSIERREFGIGYKKKIERRHLAFEDTYELRSFLINETPHYISYSIAYYEGPSLPMEQKGWQGANLVFDLDAEEGSLESLKAVQAQAAELLDLIKEELGAKKTLAVFSGNKGFHIHVWDEVFRELSSNERRKIVEYVSGRGFDYTRLFTKEESGLIRGPKPTGEGYAGRFARRALKILEADPRRIYRNITKEEARVFAEGIKEGIWSRLRAKKLIERFSVIGEAMKIHSIDVDGAVTYDIKRLIRMPNSIHGSTGFRVMPIKNLEGFEVEKAIVFSDEPVKIKMLEDVKKVELLKEDIEAKKGELKRFPLYLAVYLVGKGKALFV